MQLFDNMECEISNKTIENSRLNYSKFSVKKYNNAENVKAGGVTVDKITDPRTHSKREAVLFTC